MRRGLVRCCRGWSRSRWGFTTTSEGYTVPNTNDIRILSSSLLSFTDVADMELWMVGGRGVICVGEGPETV
jgi:hypothetical protein